MSAEAMVVDLRYRFADKGYIQNDFADPPAAEGVSTWLLKVYLDDIGRLLGVMIDAPGSGTVLVLCPLD